MKIPMPGYERYRFGDILIDEAHNRVYITGGDGTEDLVITDLDGGILRTIWIGMGAAGMTLSPDGTKLYVAAGERAYIVIVDTATYATSSYWVGTPYGEYTCPRDVAVAAGQLWFSWGCDYSNHTGGHAAFGDGIGRVDPQTGAFELNAVGSIDQKIGSALKLTAVPTQPDMLIAGESGSNPATLYRFEAVSDLLQQRAIGSTDGGSVSQLAVTPDGTQVIVPSGAPYYHRALSTSDLTEVHRYPTDAYPNAAAIRSDGLVAAGINGAYEKDVYIFEPGGSTPIATYEFGHLPDQETWPHTLVNGGLAVHGDRIYALTEQYAEPDTLTLRIRELPQ